jgi:hypothetical protein
MAQTLPDVMAFQEYWVDAWQRTILTLDVLRERGNTYREREGKAVQHVLGFPAEVVRDGRTLARPVNYVLVRIVPPDGTRIDPTKPPVVVVDPRAGHGPGIGGMKHESEIGVALAAGHACYFVGFLVQPVSGQTIEDVCRAEAIFIADVAARHPDAEGKPIVIANCQAGWQTMMMAALKPDLTGPILLAGSPLSYWAGVRGKNPMRYLGGLLGGTWLTALVGDLGGGIFDGANLVANFESLNPANTYWTKPYGLYSKVDTEEERFLSFETWWGSPVLLNANEMQWIADTLFVGNKLSSGEIRTSQDMRVDLRNIRAPIVVFCSWGDNITPPQQALGWVLDLYEHDDEIVTNGQTIVYTMHQSIGHLGIFVSGKVASKEHAEFVSCMDLIDSMPPGLYEAVITEVEEDTANPRLIHGKYLFTLEARTLDHIRALGTNDAADDARFATLARVSEVNLGLYRNFLGPMVRAAATEQSAETMRALHPNRLRFAAFSDDNPAMAAIKPLAEAARNERKQCSPDNPLMAMEHATSEWIADRLHVWGEWRDTMTEAFFLNTYGSPLLQALVGLGGRTEGNGRRIERDLVRETAAARLTSELEHRFEEGHVEEAVLRALIYVRMPQGSIDERGFAMLRLVRASRPADKRMTPARFKEMVKQQYLLLRLDEERAVKALPRLLGPDKDVRAQALQVLHELLQARGTLVPESQRRLARVEGLFAVPASAPAG